MGVPVAADRSLSAAPRDCDAAEGWTELPAADCAEGRMGAASASAAARAIGAGWKRGVFARMGKSSSK